jgi:hypothetical protein
MKREKKSGVLKKIWISSSTPDQTGSNLISREFEVALRRTTGIGSGNRPVIRDGVGHLSIKDKMIHAAGLVLGVRFKMNSPLVDR